MLRGTDMSSTLSKLFCPLLKRVQLLYKGKEFALPWKQIFTIRKDPFSGGIG